MFVAIAPDVQLCVIFVILKRDKLIPYKKDYNKGFCIYYNVSTKFKLHALSVLNLYNISLVPQERTYTVFHVGSYHHMSHHKVKS